VFPRRVRGGWFVAIPYWAGVRRIEFFGLGEDLGAAAVDGLSPGVCLNPLRSQLGDRRAGIARMGGPWLWFRDRKASYRSHMSVYL
jgi:hypothetical protein